MLTDDRATGEGLDRLFSLLGNCQNNPLRFEELFVLLALFVLISLVEIVGPRPAGAARSPLQDALKKVLASQLTGNAGLEDVASSLGKNPALIANVLNLLTKDIAGQAKEEREGPGRPSKR